MFDSVPPAADAGGPGVPDDDSQGLLHTVLTQPRAGAQLLAVAGEIDTLTAPRLEAALAELLATTDPTLVVDLSDVVFLASSGLAVLIQAAHRATAGERTLRLVVQTRAVRRPLEITGTDQLFSVHESRDDALAG